MTRPTASSASKTHDKAEIKEAPKRTSNVHKPHTATTNTKARAAKVEKPATDHSHANGDASRGLKSSVAGRTTDKSATEKPTGPLTPAGDKSAALRANGLGAADEAQIPNGGESIDESVNGSAKNGAASTQEHTSTPSGKETEVTDSSLADTPAFESATIH